MSVSVIVPVLNEESTLAQTIAALRQQRPHQIIVVDGGSVDASVRAAAAADIVLTGPRGRANQMNLGAQHATGDVLLFLHADCRLAEGCVALAERTLRRRRVVAGCFRMAVAEPALLYRSIERFATWRVQFTGIIYGDQGFFLRRTDFFRWGGFPRLRLMEDVFLSLRLRNKGRVVVAPGVIQVSARRWQQVGIVRQSVRNWTLTALAACGVHPDYLARFYPQVR